MPKPCVSPEDKKIKGKGGAQLLIGKTSQS